jgi:hypothetical protein
MPFETRWLVEKRVIVFRAWGKLTLEANAELNEELGRFIRSGQKPVHLIVIFGEDFRVPLALELLVKGTPIWDKNMGEAAIIGGSPVIRFMANVVGVSTNTRVHSVNSIEEAYRAFCKADNSLPKSL